MWFYIGEMKGDKGVVIPDPRLLVCCMVDWGKVVAIPFLSFFPFLGKINCF